MKHKFILFFIVCAILCTAAEPLLKIGVMSDTHINETRKSFYKVEPALKLFKQKQVDVIVHMGDFAQVHCPPGYRLYRQIFNEIFSGRKPQEITVFDGHDVLGVKDKMQGFRVMQKELQTTNDLYDKKIIRDHIFLIYPYHADLQRQEREIAQAVKESNGRPVFILDHVPPYDTTTDSRLWGNRKSRQFMDKFPQTIRLSGHSHGTLWSKNSIWQGKFTTVNAGCLQYWQGMLTGNAPERKSPEEVMVIEVFKNKIIFRCFCISDGSEIRPDAPWTIPWPFDEKTAPYSIGSRLQKEPLPRFPSGAKITLKETGTAGKEYLFTLPEAENIRDCFMYRTRLFKDRKLITVREFFSSFHKKKPDKSITLPFSAGYFEPGGRYTLSVTPVNFAGREGTALSLTLTTAQEQKTEELFSCSDPALPGCKAATGLAGGKKLTFKDGFFEHPGWNVRLEFPQGIWKGPAKTKFRFILDLETHQADDCQWSLRMRNSTPARNANRRIFTPAGKSGVMRYVIDFEKKKNDREFFLWITDAPAGKFKIHGIKIRRIMPPETQKGEKVRRKMPPDLKKR